MLQSSIRNFAAKEVWPIAEEIDAEDKWPEGMWQKLGNLASWVSPLTKNTGCRR